MRSEVSVIIFPFYVLIILFVPKFQNITKIVIHYTGPLRCLYERTRLPLVPVYGFFPVKLRTYIGEPIPYDPNITSDELAKKVRGLLNMN